MKKNFNKIILCVIAFSMCVFSLSFGIYAIMSAQLNLSGSVGYSAYNCSVNVSTVITGASIEAEGEISNINLGTVEVNGKNKQTASIDLGTFYFTTEGIKNALEKPYPIKIWFTIENTSAFPILAEVTLPTITDVEVVADKTSHVIEAGVTDTIMVTFTITNVSTTALDTAFDISDLSFTFKKHLKTKADIPVYKDSTVTHFENHPYYIEFGTYFSTASPLLWLVGGTVDTNGQMVALTDEDKTQLDSGKFALDKDYYLIQMFSMYTKSVSSSSIMVPYQNNFYYGTGSSNNCYLIEYPNITNVADYSLSTARQYLNGYTVNNGTKDSTSCTITPNTTIKCIFFDCFQLKDKLIYPLIKKRSLPAIYKTLGYGNTELSIPTDLADNLSANEADAFWLPTEADIAVLGDDYTALYEGSATPYYTFTAQSSSHPQSIKYYNTDKSYMTILFRYSFEMRIRPAFIL